MPVADEGTAVASTHRSPASHVLKGWVLVNERQRPDQAIDFWARPFSDIAHAQYLPSDVARGAMWYDTFENPDDRMPKGIDQSFQNYRFDWPDRPRGYAACSDGVAALSSALHSLIERDRSHSTARAAFISLDSFGPLREPTWAEVLPAFRSCYDHIVGHFHLPQRGLRQWRSFLNAHFEEGYFQEYFANAAAQCDAVILTSSGLCESDVRCCPRASTEELVGELMRDFGCALLTPAILERIVGATAPADLRKPRLFALASLRLWTMDDYYIHRHVLTDRQRDLVLGSFGDAVPNERPLWVATAVENLGSEQVKEIRRTTQGELLTTTTPACKTDDEEYGFLNYMRIIALWPFGIDGLNV